MLSANVSLEASPDPEQICISVSEEGMRSCIRLTLGLYHGQPGPTRYGRRGVMGMQGRQGPRGPQGPPGKFNAQGSRGPPTGLRGANAGQRQGMGGGDGRQSKRITINMYITPPSHHEARGIKRQT